MSSVKDFFGNLWMGVIFSATMAVDVYKYLKEEREKEKLCLIAN